MTQSFWLDAFARGNDAIYTCGNSDDSCKYNVEEHPRKGWIKVDNTTINNSGVHAVYAHLYVGDNPEYEVAFASNESYKEPLVICMTAANVPANEQGDTACNLYYGIL